VNRYGTNNATNKHRGKCSCSEIQYCWFYWYNSVNRFFCKTVNENLVV